MVEDRVIIEAKAVLALNDLHFAQLLTYLKLTDCRLGLLINFDALRLKDGLKRVVNKFILTLRPSASERLTEFASEANITNNTHARMDANMASNMDHKAKHT